MRQHKDICHDAASHIQKDVSYQQIFLCSRIYTEVIATAVDVSSSSDPLLDFVARSLIDFNRKMAKDQALLG